MVYTCKRCNVEFRDATDFKRHLLRKIPCDPVKVEVSCEDLLAELEKGARKNKPRLRDRQIVTDLRVTNNTINNNTQNTFNGTVNIVHYRIPFNVQSLEGETKYIKNADLKEVVNLPLEQSLQRYIQLRNFNSDSPACKNIMTVLNNRAMTVSEDFEWEADSARRCANVILDCYLDRLTDFATVYSKNTWHDDIYKLIDNGKDLMGMNNWSSGDRLRPLQCILDALYIQSKREYPLGSRSLPSLSSTMALCESSSGKAIGVQ